MKTVNTQTNQEKKLAPEEILEKDRQALAEVPEEWRKNYPELDRSLYVDTEKDIPLLAPYLKVKSQNVLKFIIELNVRYVTDVVQYQNKVKFSIV